MKFKLSIIALVLLLTSQLSIAQQGGNLKVIGGDDSFLNPQKYTIAAVQVEADAGIDHDGVRFEADLLPGMEITVPGDKISKAIQKLWATGYFTFVEIGYTKIDQVNEEIFLYIEVRGAPRLSGFTFEGLTKKKESDDLREVMGISAGDRITEAMIMKTESKVRGYYQEKGYLYADVDISQTNDTTAFNSKFIHIKVKAGQKVKIKEINIYNNELSEYDANASKFEIWKLKRKISDNGLRRVMKDTKQKGIFRVFSKSKFNRTAYDRDKNGIIELYNSLGLRDAKIVRDSIYNLDSSNLIIDIYIDKGERYYFGDIVWVGNTKYTSGQLDTVFGIKKGDVYNKSLLDQRLYMSMDGRDVTSLYMDRGYLFFNVEPVVVSVDSNYINYEMRITEGKEARIRNVYIRGNTKTNDYVIMREIRTKPGDLFNRNDIIRTQRELSNLGYFDPEGFQVNPIPNPEDGTVDIEYTVVERSSDQVELSGGYGAGRVIGTIGLSFTNFSTKNFFKKESWRPLPSGDGQRLSIRGQTYGRGYQSYNFSFTEPWLGGKKPNSLSVFSSYSLITNGLDKDNDLYSQTSIFSIGAGYGTRLKWPDDFFQFYTELNYQYYALEKSQYFIFSDGFSNNISLQGVFSRNSIDAPIYPRGGSKFTLTTKFTLPYSAFDGIANEDYASLTDQERYKFAEYYKLKLTGEWYIPLDKSRKLILRPSFGFGFLGSYNQAKGFSPFERFYLGGSGLNGTWQFDGREIISLRGYGGNSPISPTTGGTVISKYGLELRYPVSLNPSATIYALAFLEGGNTYEGFSKFDPFDVKRSAGMGVRIFLPMFGMLGVDFAWGFDPLDPNASGVSDVDANPALNEKGYTFGFFPIIGMNIGDL